jgi:hypothetical protein
VSAAVDLRSHFRGYPDPRDPRAVGAAFGRALAAIAEAGGGTLYVPPGEWMLGGGADVPPVVLTTPGTRLVGAGMRATVLRVAEREHRAAVAVRAADVTIERLTLRGNLHAPPPGAFPHGLTMRGDPTFLTIRDVVVEEAAGYGIYIRGRSDEPGVYTHVLLRNVVVRDCGNDGIDFKQVDRRAQTPTLRAAGPRAWLRSISIRDHSRSRPTATEERAGERGIDVRGQVHIVGLEVLGVRAALNRAPGALAVKFRATGNTSDRRTGARSDGAAWSTLDTYHVTLLAPIDPNGRRGQGIVVRGLEQAVRVGGGSVRHLRAGRAR